MRTGLVMEGGAMRGMFTCGITDVFMEQGITFDAAMGISAGVTFGCNYKSWQPGRAIRYVKRFSQDRRFCSLRSLIRTGDIYGAEFCYHTIPKQYDLFDFETFAKNPMELYSGALDIETGEMIYHRYSDAGDEDMDWMRGSASMPLVSRPVKVGGHVLLDGGIRDSIPFAFMESIGYDRNVIILTQPEGYVKEPSKMVPWLKLFMRRYPKVAETMAQRHLVYNQQLAEVAEREARGTALVFRPPESLGISRTEKDPEELERVYQIGRALAESRMDEVREFLGV